MTYLLDIDEAIDRKFLITKSMKGQADAGTIIHVMDAMNTKDFVVVNYRVARFNEKFHDYQDYTAKFEDLAQFCKWAQPDNFIARNYENFNIKDIQHYIKVKKRTMLTFCLPIILIAAAIIWTLAFVLVGGIPAAIVSLVLTIGTAVFVLYNFKTAKKKEKLRMYRKIGSKWGVVFK
ncbi:MAG: hypothetical protein MJ062_03345 [Oscillospiraceae bacterium]|nr:hypothetical protein [Oscillospiraceae bacterium]